MKDGRESAREKGMTEQESKRRENFYQSQDIITILVFYYHQTLLLIITHLLSHNFCRSEVQAQISWVLLPWVFLDRVMFSS